MKLYTITDLRTGQPRGHFEALSVDDALEQLAYRDGYHDYDDPGWRTRPSEDDLFVEEVES